MSSSKSADSDGCNPYYLHSGDNPNTALVSPLLDGSNYQMWCRSMVIALGAKSKLDFVEGKLAQPVSTDSNYAMWNKCNLMIQSWILNSCTKEIAQCIIYSSTAAEMWKILKERYSQGNGPRVFELQKDIYSLVQGSLSVTQYFNKLDTLWSEYGQFCPVKPCNCGATANETRNKIMKFLMGLNDSYAGVRGQILLMTPLPPLNQVFSYVIQEERHRSISVGQQVSLEPVALAVQKTGNSNGDNEQTEESSVQYAQGGNRNNDRNSRNRPVCGHCGKPNHVKDKCYKLHGYPPGYKFKGKPQSSNNNQSSNSGSANASATGNTLSSPPLVTQEQYSQLIHLLQGLTANAASCSSSSSQANFVNTSNSAGHPFLESDWHG